MPRRGCSRGHFYVRTPNVDVRTPNVDFFWRFRTFSDVFVSCLACLKKKRPKFSATVQAVAFRNQNRKQKQKRKRKRNRWRRLRGRFTPLAQVLPLSFSFSLSFWTNSILVREKGDSPFRVELRTSVRPSNFARIAAKLRENAFRTICNFRFFDAEIFFSKKKFGFFFDFHDFRQILEDLVNFGRQNQVPRSILLRMDRFSGPYEAWRPFSTD